MVAMRKSPGFTLIEVIVVIVVVAILATIATIGIVKFQAEARDGQREVASASVVEALEKYYDENGEYPSCTMLTGSASSVASTLGVSNEVLKMPRSTVDNSVVCGDITSATTADSIGYLGDGSTACTTGNSCLMYTLKYKEEATGAIVVLNSRRTAVISTSGEITLQSTSVTYTSIGLKWNAVQNATGYTVQRASNATFTSGLVGSSNSGLTRNETGLASATLYYFRVKANSATGDGNWSNTVVERTSIYAPATLTATTNSATQITASWAAVSGAASYKLQYSTSSSFTSPTSITGITSTSRAVTGLVPGTTYYFRVYAIAGSDTSSASPTASATTTINAPSAPALTVASATQINASWSAISGATSYTLQYATSSNFSSPSTLSGLTSTTRAVTGLSQGTVYYFRLYAVGDDATSVASATASATTTINTPNTPAVRYTSYDSASYSMRFDWNASTCPTGTTASYQLQNYREASATTWWGSAWTTTSATTYTWAAAYEGYTNGISVQQKCVKGSVSSDWSGTGQASSVVGVTGPSGSWVNWTVTGYMAAYFSWGTNCRAGAQGRYDYNFWIANATWPTGASGWYGADYPFNDSYGTSMTINSNTPNYASDDRFAAKVRFECINPTTGRTSGSTEIQTGQYAY